MIWYIISSIFTKLFYSYIILFLYNIFYLCSFMNISFFGFLYKLIINKAILRPLARVARVFDSNIPTWPHEICLFPWSVSDAVSPELSTSSVFERKRVSTWSSAQVRLCPKPPCLRTLLAHCHRSSNLLSHKDFHFSRADSVFNNPYPPSLWYPRPGGLLSAAKVSMFCLAIKIVSPLRCVWQPKSDTILEFYKKLE